MNLKSTALASLAIIISASILGLSFKNRAEERFVTVRGLSEREVEADVVIWPITFAEANNDLIKLYATIEEKSNLICRFLVEHGISMDEITLSPPAVVDSEAQGYHSQPGSPRYRATATVNVYTNKIDEVKKARMNIIELGKQGVAISGENWGNQIQFLFTGLQEIKPEMVEEATRDARNAAEKFAHDSDSRLGNIRRATQGVFTINDRDQNTPHIKNVRVVNRVEYYLVD